VVVVAGTVVVVAGGAAVVTATVVVTAVVCDVEVVAMDAPTAAHPERISASTRTRTRFIITPMSVLVAAR
jgi:hypothetical protein